MKFIDQEKVYLRLRYNTQKNSHLTTSNLLFMISNKISNQREFHEKKIRLLKNNNSRFAVFKKPLGVYAVKQRVMTLIN